MAQKLGILTIGQSPRVDMTPEMIPFISSKTEILEMGALDGLSHDELVRLAPSSGQTTLVTRLKDGGSVRVAEEDILVMLQEKIYNLESLGAHAIVVACTGQFPPFKSKIPILYPDQVLYHVVQGILPTGTLGVIVPLNEQKEQMERKWSRDGLQIEVAAASPYVANNGLEEAAEQIKSKQVDVIVLDCMGYNQAMKTTVQQITGKPVILSRTLVAKVADELLAD